MKRQRLISRKNPSILMGRTREARTVGNLPKGSGNSLLKDIPRLRKVLTSHVVEGKHRATDFSQLYKVLTLEGQEIAIGSQQGVRVNDSIVVKAEIDCDNGGIHMIDTMLKLPMTISAPK